MIDWLTQPTNDIPNWMILVFLLWWVAQVIHNDKTNDRLDRIEKRLKEHGGLF